MKPLLKWVGGKTKLLPELTARMPATYGRYYEPFAGGAALFFELQPELAVLGDSNAALIEMYRAVAADPVRVAVALAGLRSTHSKETYLNTREQWNGRSWIDAELRAAAFLYLNRTCFNGLWRVNRRGEFNVPMGRYTDPLAGVTERIASSAPALAGAELCLGDYRSTVAAAEAGDFVYLDPPYDPVSESANFTSYTGVGFGPQQQAELAHVVRKLARRGVQVMVSNSDTPRIRELYAGLRIDVVKCPRAINSNASRRGAVDEVIITAGYEPAMERAA